MRFELRYYPWCKIWKYFQQSPFVYSTSDSDVIITESDRPLKQYTSCSIMTERLKCERWYKFTDVVVSYVERCLLKDVSGKHRFVSKILSWKKLWMERWYHIRLQQNNYIYVVFAWWQIIVNSEASFDVLLTLSAVRQWALITCWCWHERYTHANSDGHSLKTRCRPIPELVNTVSLCCIIKTTNR